jgi:hypothetical protein
MADIVFRRLGTINPNGSIPGELAIGGKSWPTIERGLNYTFVRQGAYTLLMCKKVSGRTVKCLCFFDDPAIQTHLIHDAQDDDHNNLEGCIAPGLAKDANGIKDSAKAMAEVFAALGGFEEWRKKTIEVQNNVHGNENKEAWIARRKRAG